MVLVLIEVELEYQEVEFIWCMNEMRDKKIQIVGVLVEVKCEVDYFCDFYEIVLVEDKVLDKVFKKEFLDQDVYIVEQLYKFFKWRFRLEGSLYLIFLLLSINIVEKVNN